MRISLSSIITIACLSITLVGHAQILPLDSSQNYIRISGFMPAIVFEHCIGPQFSLLGGVGVGYYSKRKHYYNYDRLVQGKTVTESASIDHPLVRLNYPASLEVINENDYEPDRKGEAIHILKPYFDLEGRVYVNKNLRRRIKGKSIANNSANYVNFAGSFYTDGLKFYRLFYGIQRNINVFWVDWSAGIGYSSGELDSDLFIQGSLKLGFRLYKF